MPAVAQQARLRVSLLLGLQPMCMYSIETLHIARRFLPRFMLTYLASGDTTIPVSERTESVKTNKTMNEEQLSVAKESVARLRECCGALQTQMGSVLIGQSEVVRLLLTGLMSGGHMLVIGVPGLAKTMMVKALADLLGWDFRRIQFTPDLMPADITGTEILQSDESGRRRDLVFHRGPGVRQPDPRRRNQPHAAQDAGGAAGSDAGTGRHGQRQDLSPGAAVHRRGHAEPDRAGRHLSAARGAARPVHAQHPCGLPRARGRAGDRRAPDPQPRRATCIPLAKKEDFQRFIEIIDQTPVSQHVLEQAVAHHHAPAGPRTPARTIMCRKYVAWGAGPRATQHLVTAAKACALLDGRPAPEVSDLQPHRRRRCCAIALSPITTRSAKASKPTRSSSTCSKTS